MSEQFDVGGRQVDWPTLLEEALTMPGGMGETYSRFYNYSFGNQLLLYMQGVREPVNTYKRWQDMGRQVVKGSKAKAILRPMFRKEEKADGQEVQRLSGFRMVRCLFGVSETEGDPLPEVQPREWQLAKALGELSIEQVPFEHVNGNVQGYSIDREFAINPVAAYPFKTTMHELGHIVLGHTTPDQLTEYQTHRGVKEFQAESTAYLTVNELSLTDVMDAAESRAYIQHWLSGEQPDDRSIKQVFNATSEILKAGRVPATEVAA